ncbi:MAG: hypothetical protein CM15mP53_07790 [Ectothiorhodospiraceae bacterium]|jgi:hypothetical protein|nr:MAG: hypothetical protein CM15mP53_07790 [Ectothiorhodospiraceae bacterium]|tara:strand:- start:392 stop:562 length:171 start_codon:yes stop_codon:yes gene_type:complete
MRVLLILFFAILALGFLRKKIDDRFEFIHYLLQLAFYALIILFVYILGMHFLGNSI